LKLGATGVRHCLDFYSKFMIDETDSARPLESVFAKISKSSEMIDAGDNRAAYRIRRRTIAGHRARLRLMGEVIDDDTTNNRATCGIVAGSKL